MSGAEVASLISAIDGRNDRDNDFFGDGIWGIIMLLIIAGLFSGNGFGWGGNRGAATMVANDGLLGEEFIKRDIFNTDQNVSNTGCQTQRDVLESRYATQLGLSQLGAQAQNCCCETQKEILQNRYDNALQTNTLQNQASTNALQAQMQLAECCCNLRAEGISNMQKIIDVIQQDKIDQLREQVYTTNQALSNANLANTVINAVRPFPTPSYVVSSPYTSLYNPYNGCGCNGTSLY